MQEGSPPVRGNAKHVLALPIPHEDPNEVMANMARRRAKVEFFEEAGKYPPLAKVVRLWHQWLTTGQLQLEAVNYFRVASDALRGDLNWS